MKKTMFPAAATSEHRAVGEGLVLEVILAAVFQERVACDLTAGGVKG